MPDRLEAVAATEPVLRRPIECLGDADNFVREDATAALERCLLVLEDLISYEIRNNMIAPKSSHQAAHDTSGMPAINEAPSQDMFIAFTYEDVCSYE